MIATGNATTENARVPSIGLSLWETAVLDAALACGKLDAKLMAGLGTPQLSYLARSLARHQLDGFDRIAAVREARAFTPPKP